MATEPSSETGDGYITIRRRNLLQDLARSYTVFIDEVAVGKMWAFQTKTFSVAPGAHVIQLKIVDTGRSCSDLFHVEVMPGSRLVFRTHFRGLKNALTLPFAIPAGADALAKGEKLESKYFEWPWIRMRLVK